MSGTTLSVILPTYNCRDLIERHLKEAANWLDLADEVIVVDSFSTDGTIELIRQELRQPKLVIISRERGLYESWNKAIQVSRGDWIYISTAGDGIIRSQLQHLIETGSRLQADVVVSNARFITEDGSPHPGECPVMKLVHAFRLKSPTVFQPAAVQYLAFSTYPKAILGSTAANLYRGEHLRARLFPVDHGHGGDTAWMLRYGHETRLCVTPVEGSTFCFHARKRRKKDPLEHNTILLKEIDDVVKAGAVSDLLQMFIDQEMPVVLASRALQSRFSQRCARDRPSAFKLDPWVWTNLLLRLQAFRLSLCQARIRRHVRLRMAQATKILTG
jgi:glycosyltransferase involved in cell wall biosynthesis